MTIAHPDDGHLSKVAVDHEVDAFDPFVNWPNWTPKNQEGAECVRCFRLNNTGHR